MLVDYSLFVDEKNPWHRLSQRIGLSDEVFSPQLFVNSGTYPQCELAPGKNLTLTDCVFEFVFHLFHLNKVADSRTSPFSPHLRSTYTLLFFQILSIKILSKYSW